MKNRVLLFLTFSFSLFIAAFAAAQSFPKPAGRISDFANVIGAATAAALDQRIDQLEQKTASEIAVVTATSLDGMSVEEYADKLFREWGVGQAQQDNGVLVLVAPSDRSMRIEDVIIIPFFGLFVTIGLSMAGLGIRTRTGFPLLLGGLFGGLPLLMSLAFLGRVSLYTLAPWGVLMFGASGRW